MLQSNPLWDQRSASQPDEVAKLFIERLNSGDLDGLAALYTDDAVLAYPPGAVIHGRAAIREMWAKILTCGSRPAVPIPMKTLCSNNIALMMTFPEEGNGSCAQVLRREEDGRWLLLIDQPPFRPSPEGVAG